MKKKSPRRIRASYEQKRAIFGKPASFMTKRGYRVVNDVPEFYYVTKDVMVSPPLDGLASSEEFEFEESYSCMISEMNFANKLKQMVPVDAKQNTFYSLALKKVANYMNKNHKTNYIVYNLFKDRQLEHAQGLFHQITEYPFPKSSMVEGLTEDGRILVFSTPPPTLRQIFLVVLEMASWINTSESGEHKVLLHQPDLHSSNPSLILACLVALMHRDIFVDGAIEALPFVADLAQNFAYTEMSFS